MPEDKITLDQMIEEVEREIRLREKIYPRWVTAANPKLSATQAELQLKRMRAVLSHLQASR
jgi:hypothetical protein